MGTDTQIERYEMLNGNFNMLKNENQELQKRLTYMHEAQAKQDLKTQQAVEELVDNKSLLDSMRTENANLKAEKSLWKNIEERLSQDNESLTQERARLNSLISNLQSIQSEHERNDSETRRRLVSQSEKLENELRATKRRLDEEIEQTKKNLIRKEMDQRESQRRYDELNSNYAAAKEELVAAKTSRDHLQTRVNELTLDLKVVEEKLAVYRDKPSASVVEEEDEGSLSAVEELKIEATDLRKELEIKTCELEDVKEQVEQFKSISMANEEQLEELQAAHDQYKESMDEEAAQREVSFYIGVWFQSD
jgi:nucleoprotein TPR